MTWIVDVDEVETAFDAEPELRAHLAGLRAAPEGRFFLLRDRGAVTGWRAFLGLAKRDCSPCLALEWYADVAALIFLDEAWSEHRALDPGHPIHATPAERARVAHGEAQAPADECMNRARAFEAVEQYVSTGQRPAWLSYRFVR